MTKNDHNPDVAISLTQAEAIVLFELLSRFSETNELTVEHEAERRVLFDICASLEKTLFEPLAENYNALLQAARDSLI